MEHRQSGDFAWINAIGLRERQRLKIKYQVLLLVAAMLVVEFVLLAGMNYLLDQAEVEATNAQHTKEVIANSGEYIGDVYEVYRLLSGSDGEDRAIWSKDLNRALSSLRSHSRWLLEGASEETSLTRSLKEVNDETKLTLDLYAQIMSLPEQTKDMTRTSLRFRDRMDAFLESLSRFASEQRKLQMSDSSMPRLWRSRFKEILILALLINILFAALLAAQLIRKIVLRLDLVAENSRRMKYKMSLTPPDQGHDEITELDQAFRDMLESLKHEQEALVVSEARIRHFIAGVPVGLMSVLPSGEIEFCNASLTKMFQCGLGDIAGDHIARLFMAGELSDQSFWSQLKEKAIGRMIELFARSPDGEPFLVELMLSDSGPDQPLLASVVNIQDKYKLIKLRQAFVAMVSHELRTPLTSLSGFLTLALAGAYGHFNASFTKQLSQSQQSTNRLIALVNELLDLEKMDSGAVIVDKKPCQLDRIFEQVLNSVCVFAQTQAVEIIMPSGCDLEVMADADRLTQVLVNLISNAMIVSPREGKIHVSCAVDRGCLRLAVKDQGPGIAPEDQEIIFERFQQLGKPGAQKQTGTGLGLAICKSIVEQHGGQIGLESEVDKGSTFWFTLPYEDGSDD